MKKIPLTKNKFAVIDDEDYHYLSRFNWFVADDGTGHLHARRKIKIDEYIGMEVMIIPPKSYSNIQHKNKDTLDYRKNNLIYESYSVKRHRADKQKGKTSSKYKGVCRYKTGHKKGKPWSACIYKKIDGKLKRFHLGYFANENEAAIVYNEKALELYGELAYQNKI